MDDFLYMNILYFTWLWGISLLLRFTLRLILLLQQPFIGLDCYFSTACFLTLTCLVGQCRLCFNGYAPCSLCLFAISSGFVGFLGLTLSSSLTSPVLSSSTTTQTWVSHIHSQIMPYLLTQFDTWTDLSLQWRSRPLRLLCWTMKSFFISFESPPHSNVSQSLLSL